MRKQIQIQIIFNFYHINVFIIMYFIFFLFPLDGLNTVQGSHSGSTLDVSVGLVPSTSQAGQQMPGTSGVNSAAAAVTSAPATQEHRRLFTPQKKTVARGSVTGRGKGKRIPSCTLKFFCLSWVSPAKPPTAIRQRTSEARTAGFYNISSPHTAQRLRVAARNAKIYIRPLKKDLDALWESLLFYLR